MVLGWGLTEVVPADARGVWSARLIVDQEGLVDFLHDRQSFIGSPDVLSSLMEDAPLNEILDTIRDLLKSRLMRIHEHEYFVIAQTHKVTVIANTKASAGYCHVAAWCL